MYSRPLISFLLTLFITFTGHASDQLDARIESSIEKLDKINYLPVLLPVILNNRDFIGLNEEQVTELDRWRNTNREPMLTAMKQIVQKRVAIREAAISPTVSSARLMQMQNEIFRLQREVLEYKLSCRDQVMNTFTNENWESFFMLLAEEGTDLTFPVDYAGK